MGCGLVCWFLLAPFQGNSLKYEFERTADQGRVAFCCKYVLIQPVCQK